MNIKYGIIFMGPFPKGNVSTMRVFSYCQSLVKNGNSVKVYIIAPTKEAGVNREKNGVYQGVSYEYVSKITWANDNTSFLIKILYYIYGLFKTSLFLYKDRINIVISYHENVISNYFFCLISRLLKLTIILDRTEYPTNFKKSNYFLRRLIRNSISYYDGIITISKELVAFYSKILIKKDKVFLLPVTINSNRFDNVHKEKIDNKYISVVFGVHNRDSIIDAVSAYLLYYNEFKDKSRELFLIGDFQLLIKLFPDNQSILDIIRDNQMNRKVKFLGKVSNEEIPNILANSSCLLSTPRRFESGGFPTKLGEYLLSGVPVVTTSAGETGDYLNNFITAFLSLPGDVESISKHLIYIHKNEKNAKEIGYNGRELALRIFNPDTYIDNMMYFAENLK